MGHLDDKRNHEAFAFLGFRAHAAAIGVVQLIRELRRAGSLDEAAVGRIREAMIGELALHRPPRSNAEEYKRMLRARFDRMVDANEPVGAGAPEGWTTDSTG